MSNGEERPSARAAFFAVRGVLAVRAVRGVLAVREVFHEVEKRGVSVERFGRRNAVSVNISTVNRKLIEKRSSGVPKYVGTYNSLVFNNYERIRGKRSSSVPQLRGTCKLLITIVLRDRNRRFLPETKKM